MNKEGLASLGVLFVMTVMSNLYPLPVWCSMIVNTLVPIYIGAKRSIKLSPSFSHLNLDQNEITPLDPNEAYKFPLVASGFLFGLYVVIKYINKDLVNLVLSLYFLMIGIYTLKYYITIPLRIYNLVPKSDWKFEKQVQIPYLMSAPEKIELTLVDLVALAFATPFGVVYILTKNWMLNNLFGLCFSVYGIENISLGSFQVGFLMLGGLFFYDIFWVFGTDVMVTVAKNIDAPIKLMFPKPEGEFSIIGLGDIIIPGIFIALAQRYDIYRCERKEKEIKSVYFSVTYFSYLVGLLLTILVMTIFQAAQPALLYLVPTALISITLGALYFGELKTLFEFKEGSS